MDSYTIGWTTFDATKETDAATCERLATAAAAAAEIIREKREAFTDNNATWQTYMKRAQHMTVKYMERAQELRQEAAYYAHLESQMAAAVVVVEDGDDDDDQGYCGPTCGKYGNW